MLGQTCCPYINGLQVVPPNPTDTDQVEVILDVSTPNQGRVVSIQSQVNPQQVDIDACYNSGMIPTIDQHIDTITLGPLPAGQYSYDFTAKMSSDPNTCLPTDSTNLQNSFTVRATGGSNRPCCVEVDTAYLLPASPIYDTTQVQLVSEITTPAPGKLLSKSAVGGTDTAQIEYCYFSDTLPGPQTFRDTITLGVYPAGTVHLDLQAWQSDDSTSCNPTDTAHYSFPFTVDSTNSMKLPEAEKASFRIFPNPARDELRVERSPFGKMSLRIHSRQGRLLWEGQINQRKRIDLSNWSPGIYIISVGRESKRLVIRP